VPLKIVERKTKATKKLTLLMDRKLHSVHLKYNFYGIEPYL